MQAMRFYLDTHDRTRNTFPAKLSVPEFEAFYAQYEQACHAEGVVPVRVHVGLEEGRAFCLNMASDADAVKRVHERVGLPFDSITEITTATPGDIFFRRPECAPA
jgi:hypothetical protein